MAAAAASRRAILLDALPDPVAYVPVDISGEHLRQTAAELAADYPQIEVLPVCADFTADFALPLSTRTSTHAAVYFPGSTIGNLLPERAMELLHRITAQCGTGGGLLIGIDLKKDVATIEAAYNDRLGVTAEFNRNLLRRVNRELGADFDLDQFEHRARYNPQLGRVETSLVSRRAQDVTIDEQQFEFAAGEPIWTEYSHKYTIAEFAAIAASAGLDPAPTVDRRAAERGGTAPGRRRVIAITDGARDVQSTISTPFQNAIRPAMSCAASSGCR